MIRRRVYPGTYDRSQWETNQSDNEHQSMPVGSPYDNSYQGDISSLGYDTLYEQQALDAAAAADSGQSGAAPAADFGSCAGSYVGHTWESRPLAARDGWSDPSPTFQAVQQGNLTVPQGMIGIIRTIVFSPSGDGPANPLNDFGYARRLYQITVKVNGLPVPGFSLINVSAGFPSGGEIECFIMCQPGDVVTGAAFLNGLEVDDSTLLQDPIGFQFWATFLPNDGRNLPEQAGSPRPAPVCIDANTISQLKPPPLVVPTPNGPVVVSQAAANPPMARRNCPTPPFVSVLDYMACVRAGQPDNVLGGP